MHKRFLFAALAFIFLFSVLAIPALAAGEDMSSIGSEVVENQGDYFLYGLVILAVAVFAVLAVIFFFKRRR